MNDGRNGNAMEVFEEDLATNMQHLRENLSALPAGRQGFAASLCDWYEDKGHLSYKQKQFALEFWQLVNQSEFADAGPGTRGVPLASSDAGLKLVALFDKASETLKYPSVTYWVDANEVVAGVDRIKMWRSGSHSRLGVGNIVGAWRKNSEETVHLFVVHRDTGRVEYSAFARDSSQLVTLINKLITEFQEQLKFSGKRVGTCCYCAKGLTTAASLHVGYGPICAEKWGLPWGESEFEQPVKLEDL